MTWNPSIGSWSEENFSNASGLTLDSKQTVTGGVLTLIPEYTGSTAFNQGWPRVTNWSYENSFSSIPIIQSGFGFYTGAVFSGQTGAGYQQQLFTAGAWEIFTPYPTLVNGIYEGQSKEALFLSTGSPFSGYSNFLINGGEKFTIEVDVASLDQLSGEVFLSGFIGSGQNFLTGLPRKNGFINHGIYIDNNTYWDYLEITPFGIRSINHPELAIPEDFSTVKRVRIGISNQDIYISTESNRSVAGLGKFDNATIGSDLARIALGAPPISGYGFSFYSGISGCVGNSIWANFKLITGELAISQPTGLGQSYTTAPQTATTDSFSPNIGISRLSNAIIDFTPYRNGETTVYARYQDSTGSWQDFSSVTLSGQTSPYVYDLTEFPVSSYPNFTNLISFKIVQESNGSGLPPVLDSIKVYGSKSNAYLDIIPDWKEAIKAAKVSMNIREGSFRTADPFREIYSTFLLNTPLVTGQVTSITGEIGNEITATGEIIKGGRFETAYKNYLTLSGVAISGSAAEEFFGRDVYVSNFFPNPLLEKPYSTVTGQSAYVTGRNEGEITEYLNIPLGYTGQSIVNYRRKKVVRLDRAAKTSRIRSYFNNSLSPVNEYVQCVEVPPNTFSGTHNGLNGIEIYIPSGIVTEEVLFNIDLEVTQGPGIYINATGDVSSFSPFTITGDLLRTYSSISIPVTTVNSGEVYLGLYVPPGINSSVETIFNIDNVTCQPYSLNYAKATGVGFYYHQSGIIDSVGISGNSTEFPRKSQTVFYGDYYIESLPLETGTVFSKLRDSDQKGFEILINRDGHLIANYDLEAYYAVTGKTDGLTPLVSYPTQTVIYSGGFPLGKWTNIGFIHQVHNYSGLESAKYDGEPYPYNFASSNRVYLSIDGRIVASQDCSTNWSDSSGDPAPYVNYIADGTGTVVFASGYHCYVDALHLKRPPSAEAEVELGIKGSRSSIPYFVPDKLLKPNNVNDNTISGTSDISPNLHIGSIYNFSSPGYSNWDHGSFSNHLLTNRTAKVTDGPYTGIGSTYISQSGYALAKYSSAFDRLYNSNLRISATGELLANDFSQGKVEIMGWFKASNTGHIFRLLEDDQDFTGAGVYLSLYDNLVIERIEQSGTTWTFTGFEASTGEWTYFRTRMQLPDYTGGFSIGECTITMKDISGEMSSGFFTGAGYRYNGKSGDSSSSAFLFGWGANCYYSDWAINPFIGSVSDYTINATGDKGGSFTEVLENNTLYTGSYTWDTFTNGILFLEKSTRASNRAFTVSALNNWYSNVTMNQGIQLFDDDLFVDANSYRFFIDDSPLIDKFGDIRSPILLGPNVPPNSINLAKVDSPQYTVTAAVNSYNLADYNPNNLSIFNQGRYSINRNGGAISSYAGTGDYKGTNSEIYSGLINIVFEDQAFTSDIELTNLSIIDDRIDIAQEAYYYYLVGRGQYGVFIPDAFPHYTGNIVNTTGTNLNNYFFNKQKIKKSIFLKDSKGKEIPFNQYPYDIYYSPYSAEYFSQKALSGEEIRIDGLNSLDSTGMLPNGVFSVILVTNKKTFSSKDSVWVYYQGYDYISEEFTNVRKEIVNVSPIFTKYNSTEDINVFDTELDITNRAYDITIYGVNSGYSGNF